MIRIFRTPGQPEILMSRGVEATIRLCEDVDHGERVGRFNDKIYGDETVRSRLHAEQFGKCCYCEVRLDRATIDHFRPIKAVQQARGERHTPGYYWLAYEWENLYLACSACNESHKRDWFPLEDPAARVVHHADAHRLADERPLLLDPGNEEPTPHIRFERHTPVGLTERGRRTIDILRLNRAVLEESRGRVLGILETLWQMVEAAHRLHPFPADLIFDICRQIARYSESGEPFSAAIRAMLRRWLGPEVAFPLDVNVLLARARGSSRR